MLYMYLCVERTINGIYNILVMFYDLERPKKSVVHVAANDRKEYYIMMPLKQGWAEKFSPVTTFSVFQKVSMVKFKKWIVDFKGQSPHVAILRPFAHPC